MTTDFSRKMRTHLLGIRAALTGLVLAAISGPVGAQAAPVWVGEPNATAQSFLFTTADETVTPDTATNVLGIAEAVVVHSTPPGTGWQDPNAPLNTAGINGGDGGWDLGPDGYIEVTVPVSPVAPSGLDYDIEFHIETIVFNFPAYPTLSVAGHTIDGFVETSVVAEAHPIFGAYHRLTWTGTIAAAQAEDLVFLVEAGSQSAVVDSVEIHTRYSLNKAPATLTLNGLNQLFDGAPKPVSVVTDPVGLSVVVTYDGSPTPPTNTGSYEVVATVDDDEYAGVATGTLQIANETQTIVFPPIPDKIATDTVNLTATGGASGNTVVFSVDSGPATLVGANVLSFTGAGTVSVTATQAGNANYLAATPVTHTFQVTKATATVNLSGLSQTYDGGAKNAGATTSPPGPTVVFTYDGAPTAPVDAGSYAVAATIDDPIYQGSANGTLVVGKAAQTIVFDPIGNQLANATVNANVAGGASGNPVVLTVDFGPADVNGTAVSFTGAGSVSITATQAGGPNHLAATDVTRSFVVTKATATVNLSGLAHTYDGNAKAALATTVPAALEVDFTYEGSATAPTNAGSYAVVGTIDDPIYQGSANGTLEIGKAAQTINFPAIANQLANATLNLSATGGDSTSPVVFAVTAGPADLGVGDSLTFTGPGTVTVKASQAGDGNYLAAADATQSFTVSKAAATVTLSDLSPTYDGSAKPVGVVTVPPGLDVLVTYDGGAAVPTDAGSYAVEVTVDDPLYEGTSTDTLVIAKAAQTIVFDPIADQLATATVNLTATGGAASGNPVTFAVSSGQATIGGGNVLSFTGSGQVSVTASLAGGANYLDAPAVVRSFTVTKAAATVTVGNLSQTYDGTLRAVTTSTTPPGLNVLVTYDDDTDAPTDAGSYAVVATIDDPLYQGSAVKALTVAKAVQAINFPAISDQVATATVNLSATGGGSLEPVTFAVTTGPATIGTGGALTFTGAGAVSITASQVGNANYFPAPDVIRTFTVSKAVSNVTLGSLTHTYDGNPKSATATTTPGGLTVLFTYNGDSNPPTAAGSYGVVGTISDSVHEGSASGSFTIEKAPQTITFAPIPDQVTTATVNLSATGGDSLAPVTFAVTSGPAILTGGNVLTFSGSGQVTITATQAGNANYLDAVPVAQTFTVDKATATVTLDSLAHTYDTTAKTATATTSPGGLAVEFTYDGLSTAPTAAGSYAVIATIDDPIYEGSANGTLVIAKAAQTLVFNPIADQIATASVSLSATPGASNLPVTFVVVAGPANIGPGNVVSFSGAGSVTIKASQAEGANHLAAADVTQSFLVTKAPATVTLGDLAQVYDGTGKSATATTVPASLAVDFTYDGLPAIPVGAGSYALVATIDDPIYAGTASGTFVIAKAPQAINFPAIADQVASAVVTLSATGGGSGNTVTFAVTSGPGVLTGGNVLTFSTAGTVSVTASQAAGPNHLAAPDVTHTFEVEFSGYDAWRAVEFPGETDPAIIGFASTPVGQALPNGFRYYLGNASSDPRVITALGEQGGEWVFTHGRIEPARDDVGATYEWSTDLENWQGDGDSFGGVTVTLGVTSGAPDSNGIAPVEVRALPSGGSVDRLFVRLKLIFPAPLVP